MPNDPYFHYQRLSLDPHVAPVTLPVPGTARLALSLSRPEQSRLNVLMNSPSFELHLTHGTCHFRLSLELHTEQDPRCHLSLSS